MPSIFSKVSFNVAKTGVHVSLKRDRRSNFAKLLDECISSLKKTDPSASGVKGGEKRVRKVVKISPSLPDQQNLAIDRTFTEKVKPPVTAPLSNWYHFEDPSIFDPPPQPLPQINKDLKEAPPQEIVLKEIPPPPVIKTINVEEYLKINQPPPLPAIPIELLEKQIQKPERDEMQNQDVPEPTVQVQPPQETLDLSKEGIYPLISKALPKVIFIAMGEESAHVAKKIFTSEDLVTICDEAFELIAWIGNPELEKWRHNESIHTAVLLSDNDGFNPKLNLQISSLAAYFLDNHIKVKIALPRTEVPGGKKSFQDMYTLRKGRSRCVKVIRNALNIEKANELDPINQPIQNTLELLAQKRGAALNRSSKEPIEQRISAAVSIYNKAKPIGPENIIGVNLWLRGIPNTIPSDFRAIMIPHPDWPDSRNREMLSSEDRRIGLLSSIQARNTLENKIIAYDDQYWTVVSDVRWKDGRNPVNPTNFIVSLTLKNYRGGIHITVADGQVLVNQQVIPEPDTSILVCDFKLYARIIPYYNNRDELTGIERTFFGPNGGKPYLQKKPGNHWKSKLARGMTCGSLARLYGEKTAPYAILGEGAENVLSALHVVQKSPRAANFLGLSLGNHPSQPTNCQFVASLGVNDLIRVPLPDSVRTLILLADNDGYNMETKQTLIDTVDSFLSKGIKLMLSLAIADTAGKKRDINDVLVEQGLDFAEQMLCNTVQIHSKKDLGPSTECMQLSFLKLSLKERLKNASSEKVPEILFELGQIYYQTGEYKEAIQLYQKAETIAEGKFKRSVLDGLGSAFHEVKEYDLAIDHFQKSIKEKTLWYQTSDHFDIGNTLEGIGKAYAEKGDLETASFYLQKSLDTKLRWWKSDTHPSLSSIHFEFGNLLLKKKDFHLALLHYEKALLIKEKETDKKPHPMIAKIAEKMGDLHYQTKNYPEAIDAYKRSLEILQRVYCSDRHKLDEEILIKLGKAYYLQNNIPLALQQFVKSFTIQKSTKNRVLTQLLQRATEIQTKGTQSALKIDTSHPARKFLLTDAKILSLTKLRERGKLTQQIAIDIEMTGSLSQIDRITEIGCVVMRDFQKTGQTFQAYVNPQRSVRPEAHKITGLTQRFLQNYPPFSLIVKDFLSFIRGSDLVIHAADSDLTFLRDEFRRAGIVYDIRDQHEIIDTLTIAKQLYPNQKNSLDALNSRLNLNLPRQKHGALIDANILADVYRSMVLGEGVRK